MKILKELGFNKNWIYETIVLTQNGKHAAPMGVWTEDYERLNMDVYKKTGTFSNISKEREFTLVITDDVKIFHRVLGDKAINLEHLATLRLIANELRDLGDKVRVVADVKSHDVKGKPKLLNRAGALTLECLIKSTKPNAAKDDLLEYLRVIKKVAPKSEYEKIVRELTR